MKTIAVLVCAALCLLCGCGTVYAYTTPESLIASEKVYVSGVTYDPGSFFSGDHGTVTFTLTNANTNQTVVISHAEFSDDNIHRTSATYDTSASIGPLQSRAFVFSVETTAPEGTYFPVFSLSYRDGDSLWYRSSVKVENMPLVLTILEKPDSFTDDRKKPITIQVSNPRDNDVENVIMDVSGTSLTASPDKIFLGDIASHANKSATFSVTPSDPTTIHVKVNYYNGDNPHNVAIDIPVMYGTDKKQANPVISNVVVKPGTGIYHITGDVTNAGLETANAVTVTSVAPAVPQDPYRSYIVGALKPDDFGSFEVTFSAANATSVPLQLSFKDADGNVISSEYYVKITSLSASQSTNNFPLVPIAVIVVAVLVFAGGWFFYLRRNRK
jgi:hypothetical protein